MTVASVVTEPELQVVSRDRLFYAGGYRVDETFRAYDVDNRDRRFVMLQQGDTPVRRAGELTLIENWFSGLERIVESR